MLLVGILEEKPFHSLIDCALWTSVLGTTVEGEKNSLASSYGTSIPSDDPYRQRVITF